MSDTIFDIIWVDFYNTARKMNRAVGSENKIEYGKLIAYQGILEELGHEVKTDCYENCQANIRIMRIEIGNDKYLLPIND